MSTKSPLAKLQAVLEDGLLRAGGRLKHAEVTKEAKNPAILPRDSLLTDVLIRHIHESTAHSEREYVLAEFRRKYWLVSARPSIRHVLYNCIPC